MTSKNFALFLGLILAFKISFASQELSNHEKQRKLLTGLSQLNSKLKKLSTDHLNLAAKKKNLAQEMTNLQSEIEEAEKNLTQQKRSLIRRLRLLSQVKNQHSAQILFSMNSLSSLDRQIWLLQKINNSTLEDIQNFSHDTQALLESKKTREKDYQKLQDLELALNQQEESLRKDLATKEKFLDVLKKAEHDKQLSLSDLKKELLSIDGADPTILDGILGPSFSSMRGKLPVPIEGWAVRRNSDLDGLFLRPYKAGPVKAIAGGDVVLSEQIEGLGQVVIVDHGDHYYSVYGGISEVRAKAGSKVSMNSVIGDVGASANSEIYFELRHFVEPLEPKTWLKGLQYEKSP